MDLNFIKKHEGCRLKAYKDSVGIWTIGYGTIEYPNGVKVKQGDVITQAEAEFFLEHNANEKYAAIKGYIKAILNDNQLTAIMSLVYNIGISGFINSTVLKKINNGNTDAEIKAAWLMWNKGRIGGVLKEIPGLTARRKDELDLYFKHNGL